MTLPFTPTFIPPQVCEPVGKDPATTTVDDCMTLVIDQVRDGGVSASTVAPDDPEYPAIAERNRELEQVVSDANAKGIDLKIVVLSESPVIDTPLRDIATEVGSEFPDSTVLVLSPGFAGTYSTTYDRSTLEAGQDLAKVPGNPVQSSKNFVSELSTPHFPWTPFTIVLVLAVALAVVATRILQVRARRRATVDSPAAPAE